MISVAPTLDVMAEVYRQPVAGGSSSARFRAYVATATRSGPVHGYNPMTTQPVLDAVEALRRIDAEARLAVVANRVATALGHAGDGVMHVTVATPGMWTDRLATEVHHRLLAPDPGGVLWWFDEPVTPEAVDAEVAAQAVRLVAAIRHGPPVTLADAAEQEGEALAAGGATGGLDTLAAEALAVLADDASLSTKVGFLYGDPAARAMGFTPVGLGDGVGYRHAVALADGSISERVEVAS